MNKEVFESILNKTFGALKSSYDDNKEGYDLNESQRLIFPKMKGTDFGLRISEQELRFEFIHQLLSLENNQWWYSIETPTIQSYSGFADGNPKLNSRNGRSGAVDTMLFNKKGERDSLIEFKANNPSKGDYWKDFVKMKYEKVECNYFVQLLEAATSKTFKSIEDKIAKSTDEDRRINDNKYYCIVLTGRGESGTYKKAGVYFYNGSNIVELK